MKTKVKMIFAVLLLLVAGFAFLGLKLVAQALPSARATYYGDVPKSERLLIRFGDQISHEATFGPENLGNDVKDYLAHGMDSNYCLKMYDGWQYRNPLMLFCADFLNKSYYKKNHIVPNYETDVFHQLIKAGADIDKYPYIWAQVYLRNDKEITIFEKNYRQSNDNVDLFVSCYISDCNRVLQFFLDAGANVNKKGSSVPFEEGVCESISEKKFKSTLTPLRQRHLFMRQSKKE